MSTLEEQLSNHINIEESQIKLISDRLGALETQLSEVLDVMAQAKGALSLIKIVATIVAALASIWVFLNTNLNITLK